MRVLKWILLIGVILGVCGCGDVPFASTTKAPRPATTLLVSARVRPTEPAHSSRDHKRRRHPQARKQLTPDQINLTYLKNIEVFYDRWELNFISSLATSYPWDRIATCETGANFKLAGSNYSTAYGILDQAVSENAPRDVALLILTGKSQPVVQLRLAERLATRFGITAWARGTLRCSGIG